jgi:hypothetical protein
METHLSRLKNKFKDGSPSSSSSSSSSTKLSRFGVHYYDATSSSLLQWVVVDLADFAQIQSISPRSRGNHVGPSHPKEDLIHCINGLTQLVRTRLQKSNLSVEDPAKTSYLWTFLYHGLHMLSLSIWM